MDPSLTSDQLAELQQFDTPTVSNAIEKFGLRDRAVGFVDHSVRCLFTDLPVMVGYAATCVTCAKSPDKRGRGLTHEDYFARLLEVPAPRIAVSHDADRPAGLGAFLGEVNGTMHQALGVAGHVTDGCARDLDQLHDLKMPVFALGPCVSHAHVHLTEAGTPVRIGGCVIRPGDLLHADRHGVVVIPADCAAEVADACREVIESEREILDFCRSAEFSFDGLKAILQRRRESH